MRGASQRLSGLVLFLLASSSGGSLADADDPEVALWKVYAGPITTRNEVIAEAARRTRELDSSGERTAIECSENARFGALFHVVFLSTTSAYLQVTWKYPHLEQVMGERERTRWAHYKKDRLRASIPAMRIWYLRKPEMLDGDIILEIHKRGEILLRHVFEVRGCPAQAGAARHGSRLGLPALRKLRYSDYPTEDRPVSADRAPNAKSVENRPPGRRPDAATGLALQPAGGLDRRVAGWHGT